MFSSNIKELEDGVRTQSHVKEKRIKCQYYSDAGVLLRYCHTFSWNVCCTQTTNWCS